MIKLVIFDLDGTLCDSLKTIHSRALNDALGVVDPKFVISDEEHETIYDALPTKRKLQLLTERKGLPSNLHDKIATDKQKRTLEYFSQLERDERICEVLRNLKKQGFILAVCSNSVRETIKIALLKLGFLDYIDFYLSNQDVAHPKPSPEMFLAAMIKAGVGPGETLILEDSTVGFKAAESSGATLFTVSGSTDITYEKILSYVRPASNKGFVKYGTKKKHLNVLIPMAGRGLRFEQAGYSFPKPLIDVNGKPMIQVVVESLNLDAHFIFVAQKAHLERYNLKHLLNLIAPGCDVIETDGLTEGAACTTLLAKELINSDTPLLLANSDQHIEWDAPAFMENAFKADGSILIFKALENKWSFAKLDKDGFVTEVAEKKPISNLATVGLYFFKKGSDYVRSAEQMIAKNIRTNGEFYVCPVFNEAIENGLKINTYPVQRMNGMGTPEDLKVFLQNQNA